MHIRHLQVALGILTSFLVTFLAASAASGQVLPSPTSFRSQQQYTGYMRSFVPTGLMSLHWREERTFFTEDGKTPRSRPIISEGWAKAPNKYKHDYLNNILVADGAESWYCMKSPCVYRRETPNVAAELQSYFRPDSFGCGKNYIFTDVKSITEAADTYQEQPCIKIEIHFKPKLSDFNDSCGVATGPTRAFIYLTRDRSRVLAIIREVWDIEELVVTEKTVRVFEYDIQMNDDIFRFTPPPGAVLQKQSANAATEGG